MAFPPPLPITDAELSAYVDGEAAPERRALIEAAIARDPSQAGKVRAWRLQNHALRAAMGRLLCEAPTRPIRTVPPRPKIEAEATVTPLFPDASTSAPPPARWDRRDALALISAGSFLAGAGVACLAGYFLG